MVELQSIVLCGWIPLVLFIFAWLPPRRAAMAAFIGAWLFLPNMIAYKLGPGIPIYTKITAVSYGILIAVLVFDPHRLLAFRPRWLDLPMLIWCLCPFASSISNSHGAYDGFAVATLQSVLWGIPYVMGRIYLNDLISLREFAIAILYGGLIYVPFCWMEMRMGRPGYWHELVYGAASYSYYEGWRMGGVRPMIFMSNGLMLALWMAATALVAFWLWLTKTLRTVGGYPIFWTMLLLAVTEYRCVSTGAMAIFLFLALCLTILRMKPFRLLVVILLLLVPTYMTLRMTGLWSGANLVDAASLYDPGRSLSLDARRAQEDGIIAMGKNSFVFGVGTWEAFGADQLWILAFRNHGIVGLASLTIAMLLPLMNLWRCYPVHTWSKPAVAGAVAVAFVVLMFMIDGLFNYMFNPIYVFGAGGLMSLMPPGPTHAGPKRLKSQTYASSRAFASGPAAPRAKSVAVPRVPQVPRPAPHVPR